MNTLLRRFALTASALAALSLSVAASAQATRPPEGGPGWMRGPMGSHRMHRPPTAAEVNVRLDQQKAVLALTAAQEPAWQSYAVVVRRHAEARDAERLKMLTEHDARLHAEMDALKSGAARPAPAAASSAPVLSRADWALRRASMMKVHEAQQAEREDALKGLLAVLSPEQKLKADTLLRSPDRRHRMVRGVGGMDGAGLDGTVAAARSPA